MKPYKRYLLTMQLLVGRYFNNAPVNFREKVIFMANEMKYKYGLNHQYVVCDPSGSGAILVFKIKQFHRDHFEVDKGAIYSYESLGGYFTPPEELILKIRASESGLKLAKVN